MTIPTAKTILSRAATVAALSGCILAATPVGASAAKPHGTSANTPNCAMSAAGVGQQLTLTGAGYTSGNSYRVEMTWPNGAGAASTAAWADGSGNITVSTYAYWSGSYQASVYSTSNKGAALASCSLTVS